MKKELNIAIIGTRFMGKAHSNAWLQAGRFFDLPLQPVLKVACGQHEDSLKDFAANWGWQDTCTDWRAVVARDDVDVVDISLPQHLHAEVAIEAARHGKHIFCEKPMALSSVEAESMLHAVEKAGVVHYLNHNYRKMPAVAMAKRLIEEGQLGKIHHWRGCYLQDWIVDPQFPLTWHLRREIAGSGPHGDLNSHSVDLAHYLVGDILNVSCLTQTFVAERPLPDEAVSGTFSGVSKGPEMGKVTVEDCSLMQVQFKNGAVGSFEATRFATGRKNHNRFEINGSKGSLSFCMERPNELEFYSLEDDNDRQGFRTILCTDASHPYVAHWWPVGHNIGYEHGHIHGAVEFVQAIANKTSASPNFKDGLACIRVLERALEAAESGQRLFIED